MAVGVAVGDGDDRGGEGAAEQDRDDLVRLELRMADRGLSRVEVGGVVACDEARGSIALVGRRDLTRSAPFATADLARLAAGLVARYNAADFYPREATIRHAELEPDEIIPILLSSSFSTAIVTVAYCHTNRHAQPNSRYR
jgi:hypothetical protein